jgi:hypothetical protein
MEDLGTLADLRPLRTIAVGGVQDNSNRTGDGNISFLHFKTPRAFAHSKRNREKEKAATVM